MSLFRDSIPELLADRIGRRVIVTNSEKTWANGMKGTILEVLEDSFNTRRAYMVQLDEMDQNKPPFGKVKFDDYEVSLISEEEKGDPVNHPSHYTDGKYEVIDYIESMGYFSNFYLANAVKYISRAGKKDPDKKTEDLQKAIWYLERWVPFWKGGKLTGEMISTKDYVEDKRLAGTPGGMALELIEKNEIELAIQALKMEAGKE